MDPKPVSRDLAIERLSPREREILLHIIMGASNRETAGSLSVTEATVKAHMTSIFRKLRVRDRSQLTVSYYRSQLRRHGTGAGASDSTR